MALNRSDKSRILRRYFPGMTRNSEMSTEPNTTAALLVPVVIAGVGNDFAGLWPDASVSIGTTTEQSQPDGVPSIPAG